MSEITVDVRAEISPNISVETQRSLEKSLNVSVEHRFPGVQIVLGGQYNVESIPNGDGTQELRIHEVSGGMETIPLNVTANGIYSAPAGKAYSPVVVNVERGTEKLRQGFSVVQSGNSVQTENQYADFAVTLTVSTQEVV